MILNRLTDLNPSVWVPVLDHDDEPRPPLGEVEGRHALAPLVPRPLCQRQVHNGVRHQVVRRVQLRAGNCVNLGSMRLGVAGLAHLLEDEFLGAVHGEDKVGVGVGGDGRVPVVEGHAHHQVAAHLQHGVATHETSDLLSWEM